VVPVHRLAYSFGWDPRPPASLAGGSCATRPREARTPKLSGALELVGPRPGPETKMLSIPLPRGEGRFRR
jgi:hypothetical protein